MLLKELEKPVKKIEIFYIFRPKEKFDMSK